EHAHHFFGVEHVPQSAGQLCLDVSLLLGAVGELQSQLSVERERARHVAHHDPERFEACAHDVVSAAAGSPSSPAIGCKAATTFRMCSSSSSPSPSAPA